MGRDTLTRRQQQILDYIKQQASLNGYPPTVREIGEAVGLSSPATVYTHLSALEAKGYLKRDASKSRSISVIGSAADDAPSNKTQAVRNTTVLPLVGRVAAGVPILAEQNVEGTMALPTEIVGDSSSFMLRVRGDSMVEAGIFDGDYVVVREQQTASNGEIVVALIGNEATVKTFYREKGVIRLQPENHTMEPLYPDPSSLTIVGRVVALFRTI